MPNINKIRQAELLNNRNLIFKKLNNHRLRVGGFKASAESTDTGQRPVKLAMILSPKGVKYTSPGHRPGNGR